MIRITWKVYLFIKNFAADTILLKISVSPGERKHDTKGISQPERITAEFFRICHVSYRSDAFASLF